MLQPEIDWPAYIASREQHIVDMTNTQNDLRHRIAQLEARNVQLEGQLNETRHPVVWIASPDAGDQEKAALEARVQELEEDLERAQRQIEAQQESVNLLEEARRRIAELEEQLAAPAAIAQPQVGMVPSWYVPADKGFVPEGFVFSEDEEEQPSELMTSTEAFQHAVATQGVAYSSGADAGPSESSPPAMPQIPEEEVGEIMEEVEGLMEDLLDIVTFYESVREILDDQEPAVADLAEPAVADIAEPAVADEGAPVVLDELVQEIFEELAREVVGEFAHEVADEVLLEEEEEELEISIRILRNQCDCGRRFRTSRGLLTHRLTCEFEPAGPKKMKKVLFVCECGKRCKNKQGVKLHQKRSQCPFTDYNLENV